MKNVLKIRNCSFVAAILICLSFSAILPTSLYAAGQVFCAGWDENYQVSNKPAGEDFIAIAAGMRHSIALKSDGTIVGWGFNTSGQASPPSSNANFTAIAAGYYHNIALKSDGSMVVWGWNSSGQQPPPAGNNFTAIAAGEWHCLALKSDGSIIGWGGNYSGEATPPTPNTNFTAIAAGRNHSLALKSDGSIVGWGDDGYDKASPPAGNNYTAISAGSNHSMALKSDGSIVCWGWNYFGQCTVPSPNANFVAISAGGDYSLAVKSDGSVVCWGDNWIGQCTVPSPNTNFVAVAGGRHHSIFLNKVQYNLESSVVNGHGTISPAGLYDSGTVVNLTATPDAGYRVKAWTGADDVPSAGNNNNTVTMTANKTVTVEFELRQLFGDIPGIKKNTKLTVYDSCSPIATFSLTGGGYGEVSDNASRITLYGTGEKSLLTISTPKGKTATISYITTGKQGSLKGIMAKTTNLNGNINVADSLGTLTLKDAKGSISIGTPVTPNPKAAVTITFNQADGLNINSDMPIKSITALGNWWGTLTAQTVGSITSKGSYIEADVDVDGDIGTIKVDGLSGSWNCQSVKSITASGADDFYLTLNQIPDTKKLALGNMTIKGDFSWSRIISSGNIGTVTFGMIEGSTCFAGVDSAAINSVFDLPAANAANFSLVPATIKSISIKGYKGESPPYFVNSNIAAANILSLSLLYPEYNNGGKPFGVTADFIKSMKIKDYSGNHPWKMLSEPSQSDSNDDAKIRIY
jgi:hypothetical protein